MWNPLCYCGSLADRALVSLLWLCYSHCLGTKHHTVHQHCTWPRIRQRCWRVCPALYKLSLHVKTLCWQAFGLVHCAYHLSPVWHFGQLSSELVFWRSSVKCMNCRSEVLVDYYESVITCLQCLATLLHWSCDMRTFLTNLSKKCIVFTRVYISKGKVTNFKFIFMCVCAPQKSSATDRDATRLYVPANLFTYLLMLFFCNDKSASPTVNSCSLKTAFQFWFKTHVR